MPLPTIKRLPTRTRPDLSWPDRSLLPSVSSHVQLDMRKASPASRNLDHTSPAWFTFITFPNLLPVSGHWVAQVTGSWAICRHPWFLLSEGGAQPWGHSGTWQQLLGC